MIALKRRYIISTSVAVVLLAAASWILSKAYASLHADLLPMLGLTLVGMLLMGAMWFLFAVARRQRAESEALHRAMLEATPDLMFRLSETGEYLDFHATDAARSRLASGTRVGATVKDALPPAVAEQWLDAIQGALRSGSAQSLEYDLPLLQGVRYFEARVVPFGFNQVVSIVRDISERIQAEEALRESERKFRAIFDQAVELIGATAPDGTILEVNRAVLDLFGVEQSDLFGKTMWDIPWMPHSPERQEKLQEQFREAITRAAAGELVHQVHYLDDREGETHVFDFAAGPVRDDEGNIDFLVARSHDITERVRAAAELRQSRQQLRTLSRRLIEVQEKERSHMARELHDHVGQALTAVKLNLDMIDRSSEDATIQEHVADSASIVGKLLEEVRNLAFELRPPLLDDLGLVAALRWYTNRQAERAGIVANFNAPTSETHLASEVASACFRVAQEAITNVMKHASARHLDVELQSEDDELTLTVRDDGVGFDVDTANRTTPDRAGMGIVGMQERVSLLEGSLAIESEPGGGTTARARFPTRRDNLAP